MIAPRLDRRHALRLGALFSALLAGCTDRPLSEESESAGMTGGETGSTAAPTTDAPAMTSGTSATSGADTGTSTTTSTSNTRVTSDEPPVCVYSDHLITLTAEEYAYWVEHGAPPPGDTTGGDTTGEASSGGSTGDTSGGSTGGSTGGSSGGTTGGMVGWSYELCVQICVVEAGVADYDVTECHQNGVDEQGNVEIYCQEIIEHCDGRTHACVRSRGAAAGDDPVGAWFARATHDEAASVYAFIALGQELAEHGAPAELLAKLRAAAGDEIRHAAVTSRLARRGGGVVRRPRRGPHATRSLVDIARENAAEGCVRETWAALSAAHQAAHAEDPEIRAAMATIAGDEARHAELAWALDAWLMGQLAADQRAEVEAARRGAVRQLERHLASQRDEAALVTRAGVPARATARRLVAGLERALWDLGTVG